MSIGQTRGGIARFIETGGTVPDVAEALAPLRATSDLPGEFWDALAERLHVAAILRNSQRIDRGKGAAIDRAEKAASEFKEAILDLQRQAPMMFRRAGREMVDHVEFWDLLVRFQELRSMTFEGSAADAYRKTIVEVSKDLPQMGISELTRFLEKIESALPGCIFPPDREPSARRDYVKNALKSVG